MFRKSIAIAAISATFVFVPAPVYADNPDADTRPCVANSEVWHVPSGLTRRQVEIRWEEVNQGQQIVLLGRLVWAYNRCEPTPPGYTTNMAWLRVNANGIVVETGIYQD